MQPPPESHHVLLIRHGQTAANAAGIVQGHLPTPLNEVGEAQSHRLGQHLRTRHPTITTLLTSPLPRAVQTADIVAHHLKLPATQDPRWVERHFGSQQGQHHSLHRIMTHGGQTTDPPDAEPRHTFDLRVAEALASLTEHPPAVTAVITHGGVIGSVLRQLIAGSIDCDNPPAQRIPIPNGAILHLTRRTTRWHVLCCVETSHLSGLETVLDAG